jgi:L-aminopeptidase/D-esterase-like protein
MSQPDAGVQIGHWTSESGSTGCTVVVFDRLTPAAADVRGGAPGTRETDLLGPGRSVGSVDAIVLTGGSAFGLATADGVMRWLRERNRGYPTHAGPVPIVAAAVLFDLDPRAPAPPDAESGYKACGNLQALPAAFAGRVGAGAGATYQKLWGPERIRRGGIGIASVELPQGRVTAVVALNAVGAPATQSDAPAGVGLVRREALLTASLASLEREATTIGVIVVEAPADRALLARCAVAAHDGLARSIVPAHTALDGDVFFAAGTIDGTADASSRLTIPLATELAVERAIARIVEEDLDNVP